MPQSNFQQRHRTRSFSMVLTLQPPFRCIPVVICLHLLPLQAQHESGIFSPGCWGRLYTMLPLLLRTRSVLRLTRTAWLCDFLQMGTGEWGVRRALCKALGSNRSVTCISLTPLPGVSLAASTTSLAFLGCRFWPAAGARCQREY